MSEMYTIRNMDEKTKKEIQDYAAEHELSISEAIEQLIRLAKEHLAHTRKEKKHKSIFEVYDKIKFSTDNPKLSEEIDKALYGKRG